MGIVGSVWGILSIIGLLLGGVILEFVLWYWLFYINIFIVIVVIIFVFMIFYFFDEI